MWERFSFYGMQGILLIYMYYSVSRGRTRASTGAVAAGIVGAYGGAVYLSTILGAWLADRLLGSERVLFFSAIVIMAGHIALAAAARTSSGLGVGLVLVAVGSGGLKANATSVVGTLYAADDARRDAGFSLFYLGINLGAFLGPIAHGAAAVHDRLPLGLRRSRPSAWRWASIQYSFGRRALPDGVPGGPEPAAATRRLPARRIGIAAAAVGRHRRARARRGDPRRQPRDRRHHRDASPRRSRTSP